MRLIRQKPNDEAAGRRRCVRTGRTVLVVVLAGLAAGAAGRAWAQAQADPAASEDPQAPVAAMTATDSEAQALIDRARQLLANGDHRLAVGLLQGAIDRHGQHLIVDSDGLYVPTRTEVERVMADWHTRDRGLLGFYRLKADAEASRLIGPEPSAARDVDALRQVVERYFLSSYGDEAAFGLACLMIDRGRFAEATDLLEHVLHDYPDPTMDRSALLARLALSAARAGDRHRASRSLAALQTAADTDKNRLAEVRREVALMAQRLEAQPAASWTMAFGGPQRDGLMPGEARPASQSTSVWAPVWQRDVPRALALYADTQAKAQTMDGGPRRDGAALIGRAMAVCRWRANNWRPSDRLLWVGDRLFVRSGDGLAALQPTDDELLWEARLSNGRTDRVKAVHAIYARWLRGFRGTFPATPLEMALFGDRTQPLLAYDDGRVYALAPNHEVLPIRDVRGQVALAEDINHRNLRYAANRLVAFDATSGRQVWTKAVPSRHGSIHKGTDRRTRICSAPMRVGDHLLVAVADHNELALVALAREDGEDQWRQYLCSSPQGVGSAWAPVRMVRDGVRVYIATGHGLVMAVDGQSGDIRWANTYPRPKPPDSDSNIRYGDLASVIEPTPWEENAIFVSGDTLIVVAANQRQIQRFDRRTGKRLDPLDPGPGDAMRNPGYVLGMREGRIIVGGSTHLLSVDTATGKLAWASAALAATGRAALSRDAIYVPCGDRIVRLDPDSGKQVATAAITSDLGDPTGNLYSDGQHLFSVGAARITALNDGQRLASALDAQIKAGDPSALLRRARIHEQLGKPAMARADLRVAVESAEDDSTRDAARSLLVENLLTAVQSRPDDARAEALLDELAERAAGTRWAPTVDWIRADWLVARGRLLDAARIYVDLGLGEQTHLALPDFGEPTWQMRSDQLAHRRLAALAQRADAKELRQWLAQQADQALAGVTPQTPAAQLRRLAETYRGTDAGIAALRRLGDRAADPDAGHFGPSEGALRAVMRGERSDLTSATAAMVLADVQAARGWPRDARETWREAIGRHGTVRVPDGQKASPLAQIAREPLARLDTRIKVEPDPGRLLAPPYRIVPVTDSRDDHVLVLSGTDFGERTEYLRSQAMVYSPDKHRLTRHDPTRRFKQTGSVALPEDAGKSGGRIRYTQLLAGGLSGNVLVLLTEAKTLGVDLVDMKILWQRDADRSFAFDTLDQRTTRRGIISPDAIGHGVWAAVQTGASGLANVVSVHDVLSGEPLWRREVGDSVIQGVVVAGDRVIIVADVNGHRHLVCDRRTGRVLREVTLDTFTPYAHSRVTARGAIYHHGRNVHFVPYDEQREPWSIRHGESNPLFNLCLVNDHLAALTIHERPHELIDLRTGKSVWTTPARINKRILDVHLDEQKGVAYFRTGYHRGDRLVELDLRSGETLRRIDYDKGYTREMPLAHVAGSGPLVPRWVRSERDRSMYTLHLYDRATGKRIRRPPGPTVKIDHLRGLPIIRGGALIAASRDGVRAVVNQDALTRDDAPGPQPDE